MAPYKKVYKDLQKKTNQWKITFFFTSPPPSCTVHYLMIVITFRREHQHRYDQCQHEFFLCFHLSSIFGPTIICYFTHNCVLFPCFLSQPVCPVQLAIWKQQVYHEYTYTLLQFTIQQFCLLHIFSLYRRIPPVLPLMQQIKILFSNCCIQHQLMCSLMMDQEGPAHVVQCFKKYY